MRDLKLSFNSIEEINRIKRDQNIYKHTQRNQLGVAKSSLLEGKRRMKWIDLFNIGNVMLLRGQSVQHGSTGCILEFNSKEELLAEEEAHFMRSVVKAKGIQPEEQELRGLAELSLARC